MPRLIVLAGASGTGKSAVRKLLGPRLEMRDLGPDDHPARWRWVLNEMDRSHDVLLECCKVPSSVRSRLWNHGVLIELTASQEVRRQRLEGVGRQPYEIDERLSWNGELGYEDSVPVHKKVDTTTRTPGEVARELHEWLWKSETPPVLEVRHPSKSRRSEVRHRTRRRAA